MVGIALWDMLQANWGWVIFGLIVFFIVAAWGINSFYDFLDWWNAEFVDDEEGSDKE